jgi:polysaccharide deacetylase 2 family uncharacterized protein YibQ
MARRGGGQLGVGWILTWPLTLAFGAMVFLSARELNRGALEGVTVIGGPGWAAELPRRINAVTEGLQQAPLTLPEPSEEQRGSGAVRWTHRAYTIAVQPEDHAKVETAIRALQQIDPGLTVTSAVADDGAEVRIGLDGLLTHTLRLRSQAAEPTPRVSPQLAMLVAALGDNLKTARDVVDLDVPVALGVRPFRPFSKEVAELAHHFAREVWLDLSAGEADDVAPGDETPAIRDSGYLDSALASVPYVVGVTQEPGGGWSEEALAAEARQRRLLYVGARQVVGSAAPAHAPEMVSITSESPEQLAALGARIRERGPVIAVSHEAEDLGVLRDLVPAWRAAGVEVVPLSSLLRAPALPAR